jgi:hypothetical protein
MNSGVTAAIISAIVSVATTFGTLMLTREQLLREYRLEEMSELAAKKLLTQSPYRMRSFEIIKLHLAGFEENELRRVLVRAGAVRWQARNDKEVWGLLDRNECWLSEPRLPVDPDTPTPLEKCPPGPKPVEDIIK